jgi:hypothetical protein
MKNSSDTWGSHSEDYSHLGRDAMQYGTNLQMFRMNLKPVPC